MTAADGGAFPVATRRISDPAAAREDALRRFGAPTAVWRRGDESLTGYGTALRLVRGGPDRLRSAAAEWRRVAGRADVTDDARVPGSGAIAFGAFAFADVSAAESVLVVPRRVVGQRDGVAFLTTVPDLGGGPAPRRDGGADEAAFPPEGYSAAVRDAVARIRDGGLEKVVLARDLPLRTRVDLTAALDRLADRYRESWVFAVDGFFGASPETLVTVRAGAMGSRVLAGTARRGGDDRSDDAARAALLDSPKNRFEHALAVDSLLLTLGDAVDGLVIGRPFALGLPGVWHLATDATARVRAGVGALDLAAALHPTAAVAGAPRQAALDVIAELEPFDRRRYAGPVGWVDAAGDGEWAIGLRSAEVEADGRVRAYAGAGIVAGSDAEQELAETGWKFEPVLEAVAADLPAVSAIAGGTGPAR